MIEKENRQKKREREGDVMWGPQWWWVVAPTVVGKKILRERKREMVKEKLRTEKIIIRVFSVFV